MLSTKKLTCAEICLLLNCLRLPGRLTSGETAALLGFQEHDIGPLAVAKLLVPLGKPAPNAAKYFASVDVLQRANDPVWLSTATRTISRFWKTKNGRKSLHPHGDADPLSSEPSSINQDPKLNQTQKNYDNRTQTSQ